MATQIGTLGNIPTLTVGGRLFTDVSSSLKRLITRSAGTGGGTFRLFSGSSGYQVTGGKTLTIEAIRLVDISSSAGAAIILAQTDNDIGINSATALTNPVYWGGSNTLGPITTLSGNGVVVTADIYMPIAASKYATCSGPAGNDLTFLAWGYEA